MASQEKSAARPRLGRGLSSLISNSSDILAPREADYQPVAPVTELPKVSVPVQLPKADGRPREIALADIAVNPYQPRKEFDPQELADLAQSISQQGILQALLVAEVTDSTAAKPYVLIAGERRMRAAQLAGLVTVPCITRPATAQQMLEWALIENIHRAELNPMERAIAYHQYLERFKLTQVDAAQRLGHPRATLANYLRLIDLHGDVQAMISQGVLSFGHAKVLAGLLATPQKQLELARRVVAEGLSVRQLEQLATQQATPAPDQTVPKPPELKPAYMRDLEDRLTQVVGTKVSIQPGRGKHTGRIVVEFYSLDDFDRISSTLGLKDLDKH